MREDTGQDGRYANPVHSQSLDVRQSGGNKWGLLYFLHWQVQ